MPTFEFDRGTIARHPRTALLALLLDLLLGTGPALGQGALIAGRITDGSNGVNRVTVQAVGLSANQGYTSFTDADGNYSLSGLPVDTYTVTPSQSGTVFEPVSCLYQSNCGTNTDVIFSVTTLSQTNVDFSVVYSISGRVVAGANPLPNVQMSVTLPPRSAVTDQTGSYTLSGFPRGGPYTVTPTKANYTFNPSSSAVTVASNVIGQNFTASAFFTISGRITNGRLPVTGATVLLQSSQLSLTNKSDANGSFAFTNLAAGNYTVTPSLAGYAFNPTSAAVSGPTNINFAVVTLPVGGRIIEGNIGLGGVTVFAISATATTNVLTKADGSYLFQNLAGTYTIMPSNSTDQFNPARRTLSVGQGLTAVDFQRGPPTFDVLATTCDPSSLQLALSTGGKVGFGCGAAVGTVTFTKTVTITTDTFLDARTNATFSGGNAVRLFTVNPGVGLTFKNLTLTGGKDAGASGTNGAAGVSGTGGAIYNNGGVLALANCVLTGNSAAGGTGGTGVVQLNGSGGKGGDGGSAFGGAIYNYGGSVALTNCTLSGNTASGGAGANGADANSGGNGNNGGAGGKGGVGSGGAIFSAGGGTVVVYDCTFASNNVSGATAGAGGAGTGLGANGANGAPGDGFCGGIYNDGGTLTVLFSTFQNNAASGATGGDGKAGAGEARGASGTSGSAAGGGALYNSAGSLAATNCTFDGNSVTAGQGGNGGAGGTSGLVGGDGGNGGSGGSGRGGAICNTASGSVLLVNCTITDNGALGGAQGTGGAAGTSRARSGNDGLPGEDYGGGIANTGGTMTLINTLLGFNAPGGNGAGLITDGGYNLSDDASVPLTAMGSNITNLQGVGILGNYGGPTLTVPIFTGSPAVDKGNDDACLPTDQRHLARMGRCDIGAFEFNGLEPTTTLSIVRQTAQVLVSWTSAISDYSLQSTPDLTTLNWTPVINSPIVISNRFVVTDSVDGFSRFYRLKSNRGATNQVNSLPTMSP